MPSITANGFKALVFAAFFIAVLGGVWRGIGSCGGYVWHDQAMFVVLAIASLSLAFVPNPQQSFSRRALLVLTVIGTFFAVRALSAPFYPAFPGVGDYFPLVWVALTTGPC